MQHQHRSSRTRTRWAAVVPGLLLVASALAGAGCSQSRPAPSATGPGGTGPGANPTAAPGGASTTVAGPGRALLEAAGRGDADEVGRLITSGADLEATDSAGRTALVVAAYGGHLDVAARLIGAGADVNHQDETKQSAYLIATSEIGADTGLALLRLTLAHGADLTALDRFNGTGLIRAAHRGYDEIVDELLRAGITVDHVNGLGWTALLESIILGQGDPRHTRVVELLLAAGANPDLADREGVTPLGHARARNQEAVVRVLTAAGARPGPAPSTPAGPGA